MLSLTEFTKRENRDKYRLHHWPNNWPPGWKYQQVKKFEYEYYKLLVTLKAHHGIAECFCDTILWSHTPDNFAAAVRELGQTMRELENSNNE